MRVHHLGTMNIFVKLQINSFSTYCPEYVIFWWHHRKCQILSKSKHLRHPLGVWKHCDSIVYWTINRKFLIQVIVRKKKKTNITFGSIQSPLQCYVLVVWGKPNKTTERLNSLQTTQS